MRLFGDSTDITDGIDSNIWSAVDKSIENNNLETFRSLERFVRRILQMSIRNKSIKHFQKYIFFPAYFYSNSYEKVKKHTSYTEFHKYCTEQAALHLKEIIWFDIGTTIFNNYELEDLKIFNQFYYQAFNGFSRLLYYMAKNGDVHQFQYAIEQYDQILDGSSSLNFGLKWEIRDLEKDNDNGINDEIIKQKKEVYKIITAFDDYKRHVITGIKYWIFYLYDREKINEEIASALIELLNIHYSNPEDILDDILFFRNSTATNYMEWSRWDFEERPSGKVYSPPTPNIWMIFGFVADQIREKNIYVNVNELNSGTLSQTKYFYDELKRNTEYFKKDFDKWSKLLNTDSQEDLNAKIEEILRIFLSAKRKSITEADRAIATAPLYKPFVENYKFTIGKAWKSNARIHRLFKQVGNALDVSGKEIELMHIGRRVFFEKAKMMFTEKNHEPIYGSESMGGQIGRWEDNHFFRIIFQGQYNRITGASAIEIIDQALTYFSRNKIIPDIIIVAPDFQLKDRSFKDSKRFVSKSNVELLGIDIFDFLIGTFDNIPIYISYSDFLNSKILIGNFNKAFQMLYKTNPSWFKNELTVDVKEVSKEEALKILEDNRSKWVNTEDEDFLSDEEALLLIRTGVNIDIWTTIDFKVLDKEAYVIGSLKNETYD